MFYVFMACLPNYVGRCSVYGVYKAFPLSSALFKSSLGENLANVNTMPWPMSEVDRCVTVSCHVSSLKLS